MACTLVDAGQAEATLVYEFIQLGSDVALQVSGSLTGLPAGSFTGVGGSSFIFPSLVYLRAGNFSANDFAISGPTSFGAGNFNAMTYTGYGSYLAAIMGTISLPTTYVEGSAITGSGLFTSATLSSLGLSATSGLLGTWTVGSDTIELWAGAKPSSSPAPGPLPLLGAGAAFATSRRLRSRLRSGASSPQA